MRTVALVSEVVVKIIVSVAAGWGAGLLAFAIVLQKRGDIASFDDLGERGPPPAETLLAAGLGLLVMAGLLLLLSVGPLAERRWFISAESSERPPHVGDIE